MADLKISQLSAATALAGTEVVPVVQGGSTKKATIDQILAPAAGKGVDFSANTGAPGMTSELLNWYEEGTWTPVITSQSGTLTSYTSTGYYVRVGRMLHVFGSFAITNAGTAAGQAFVSGLPFTSLNLPAGPDVIGTGVVREYNMTGNAYFINVADNATTASIVTALNAGITWLNGYGYLWSVTYQTA